MNGQEDDDDLEIQVGDGTFIPRNLLTFKLLMFDRATSLLISPVMNIGALRECNIVLHQQITQERRSKVPDVPVVYMVEPTNENIRAIVNDA